MFGKIKKLARKVSPMKAAKKHVGMAKKMSPPSIRSKVKSGLGGAKAAPRGATAARQPMKGRSSMR